MQLLLWTYTENTEMDLEFLSPITTPHFTSVGVGVGCIKVWVEVWCRCVSLPVTQT